MKLPSRDAWKRRPIFLWQIRFLFLALFATSVAWTPALIHHTAIFVHTSPALAGTANLNVNPCASRPTPPPLPPADSPPTLFFLHIPKTAGTLMYRIALQYANRTNGLACNYVHDGNRLPPSAYGKAPVQASFAPGTPARAALDAIERDDVPAKARLLEDGVCRTMRGHITFAALKAVHTPTLAVTVVRDPLARFVSMYEFVVAMVKARPGATGWDHWLDGSMSLAARFANSSSIFHQAFYDAGGQWVQSDNAGFSFHFYGVLHQLSGVQPEFEGVGDPFHFGMRNDAAMAEAAKDNLCRAHVVGRQEDMTETWHQFFETVAPYAQWSEGEKKVVGLASVNRTPDRVSRNVDDHLPARMRAELERRLAKEIEVVEFAKQIVAYRKALRESAMR